MTYDELSKIWSEDGQIDQNDIISETTRVPKLHNKYYTMYVEESLRMRKLMSQKKIIEAEKYEYFSGQMDIEDMRERGWKPLPRMILKSDVSRYVDSDSEVIDVTLKIAMKKELCDFLQSIISMITYRSQSLKLIHDVERFRSGS